MSKKLVSLVLALMMLATVALAESVPSKTTEEPEFTEIQGVTVLELSDEAKEAQNEVAVEAVQKIAEEGKDAFTQEAQDRCEALGIDLDKQDFENAVILDAQNWTVEEGSTAVFKKPAGIEGKTFAVYIVTEDGDLVPVECRETETGEIGVTFDEYAAKYANLGASNFVVVPDKE